MKLVAFNFGILFAGVLVAEIIFNVQPVNKKITFKKKKIMESMSDKFQERKYEKIIKQNFAKSFSDSLVFELQLFKLCYIFKI
mgnify:CR=1 FL=1